MPDNTTTNTNEDDDFEVDVNPIDNAGNPIDPVTGDVVIGGDGNGDSGNSDTPTTINIQIVNANKLTELDSPNDGLSFIMVDRNTNTGMILDYNKLTETIYSKLYSENADEDTLKFYFIS